MAEQAIKAAEGPSMGQIFSRGFLTENPSLRQMLGLCPTLAVTTAVSNGIGRGLATTFVLVCSGIVVSLLRKAIPNSVRIPAFITVIASFVTLVMMIVKAYLPALDDALGIYLPLIVVNCIVLGRAEMFASKNAPVLAAVDGLGMGLGFTISLVCMSAIRELLGAGTLLGFQVMPSFLEPMIIMVTPAGGFAVLGLLIAASVWLEQSRARKAGLPVPEAAETPCAACPIDCGVKDPTDASCALGEATVEKIEAAVVEAVSAARVEEEAAAAQAVAAPDASKPEGSDA
ncbi:MAG: electron transport complex subunit E [Atopobiaceae bacterium]|nr:electron transport complex subunit E [Atopobiaceae bacterium]